MKTLKDFNVRVLRNRYVKEYKGLLSVKSKEVPESDWSTVYNLDTAINTRFDDGAHFQAMQVPGADRVGDAYPRVGRTWAIELWKDEEIPIASEALPRFELVVLDLDHGDKTTDWSTRPTNPLRPEDEAFFALLTRLRAEYGFAYYLSRSGARLFGLLETPLTLDVYEDYMGRLLLELDSKGYPVFDPDPTTGFHIDASCFDLGRLFKLPFVPGSDPSTHAWYEPTFTRVMPFEPGALLPWTFNSKRSGVGRPTTPPPSSPKTFKASDLKALKGTDYYDTIIAGDAIAGRGERHVRMLSVAGSIAKRMRLTDPEDVYGIMFESVRAAVLPSDRESEVMARLWEHAHYVAGAVAADVEVESAAAKARGHVRNNAYARISELTGCDPAEAVHRLAVATNKGVFYPYDEIEESYVPVPYSSNQLAQAFLKHCPTLVDVRTEKGGYVADRTLALRYTSADVSEVRYVYGGDATRVDLNQRVLFLPVAQVRKDLVPTYHKTVAQWFELLAGAHHSDMLGWCARFPDLTKPLCALYIHGEKSVGKAVLARGLAQIWGAEAADYTILGERFQNELLHTPMLFADENITLNSVSAAQGTTIFRSNIGNKSHSVEEKRMDVVRVIGFRRIVIGANNTDAMKIREDLSREDISAVQDRVGYIRVPDGGASKFLAQLSWDEVEEMITRQIPEHVLWLAANHKVSDAAARSRFGSWDSDFVSSVKLDIGRTRVVGEVVGRWFLSSPLSDGSTGILAKDGLLYVQSTKLLKTWKGLIESDSDRAPTTRALTTALRALAPETEENPNKTVRNDAGKPFKAWTLDPHKIAAILDDTDCDVDAFRAAFDLPAPGTVETPVVPPKPAAKTAPKSGAIAAFWKEEIAG